MDAWGNFWQKKHSTTFAGYYPDGYTTGYIADWWADILRSQKAGPTNVLEVGCGNASLLPRMLELGVCGTYTGVDVAKVQLCDAVEKRRGQNLAICLISEVAIEAFKCDQRFDIIASVYGVEYSPLELSLPVLKKLLCPQETMHFLVHHSGSVITAMSKKALTEFNFELKQRVLGELQAIDSLLVKQKGDLSKLERSSRAQIARERINQFISSVINVEPAQRNPILIDFAGAVLLYFKKLRLSKQERQLYLDSIMLDFQASQERFKQMVNVACDEQSIFSVEALLARSGFKSVRVSVLDNQGVPVAWNIQASLF